MARKKESINQTETFIMDGGVVEHKDVLGTIITFICVIIIGVLITLATLAILYS